MIIILLGAPGAGKGTQSEFLERRLGVVHISSGDLLRDHIRRGTELGKVAEGYMNNSLLVPDDLVIDMIVDRLAEPDAAKGVLLDGFPRTLPQCKALDNALHGQRKRVDQALYINVARDMLVDRLSGRWTCPEGHVYHEKFNPPKHDRICDIDGKELFQRPDDTREKAEKRLAVYFEQTLPIIGYYRDKGILCEIDGERPIEQVTEDLLNCLK